MRILTIAAALLISTAAWAECKAVNSSWISELCYNGATTTATMSGKRYTFCGISRGTFDAWAGASSAGTYYNDNIKGRYQCY